MAKNLAAERESCHMCMCSPTTNDAAISWDIPFSLTDVRHCSNISQGVYIMVTLVSRPAGSTWTSVGWREWPLMVLAALKMRLNLNCPLAFVPGYLVLHWMETGTPLQHWQLQMESRVGLYMQYMQSSCRCECSPSFTYSSQGRVKYRQVRVNWSGHCVFVPPFPLLFTRTVELMYQL